MRAGNATTAAGRRPAAAAVITPRAAAATCSRRPLCRPLASASAAAAAPAPELLTVFQRTRQIEGEAEAIVARARRAEQRYNQLSQLMAEVPVRERRRLAAASREAEHRVALLGLRSTWLGGDEGATTTATGAETARVRVHINALRSRRLQMSLALGSPEHLAALQQALHAPDLLREQEELLFASSLQRLHDIRRCNRRLHAELARHAAATCANQRRLRLLDVAQPSLPAALLGDEGAQEQVQRALRDVEQLHAQHEQELDLHGAACEQEAALAFATLEVLAAQMAAAEQRLVALLNELSGRAACAATAAAGPVVASAPAAAAGAGGGRACSRSSGGAGA